MEHISHKLATARLGSGECGEGRLTRATYATYAGYSYLQMGIRRHAVTLLPSPSPFLHLRTSHA